MRQLGTHTQLYCASFRLPRNMSTRLTSTPKTMEPENTDVYVDVIAKLIRLTIESGLSWTARELLPTEAEFRGGRIHEAEYKEQRFLLEEKPVLLSSKNMDFSKFRPQIATDYALSIERPDGTILLLPRLAALKNLSEAIKQKNHDQLMEVSRLLD